MTLARSRGFTLLEVLIVLGLLALASGWYLSSQVQKQNDAARAGVSTEFYDEFRVIARAARDYGKAHASEWTVGTPVTVTVAQLITDSLLPTGFASRRTGTGRTPLGTLYTIRAVRNASGPPSVVVYETGDNHAYYAQRLGLPNTAAPELSVLRRQAASKLAETGVAIAVINAGSRVATSISGNGWTKDLTALVATAPSRLSLAVLTGFPDLSGLDNGEDPTANEPFSGDCKVLTAERMCRHTSGGSASCSDSGAVWQETSCSAYYGAGWEKVDEVTTCPTGGAVSFRATPVGQLSYGTSTRIVPNTGLCNAYCDAQGFPCEPGSGSAWQTAYQNQELRINDQLVATQTCITNRDTNRYIDGVGNAVCGYATADYNWANGTVSAANPHHVLCCRSN